MTQDPYLKRLDDKCPGYCASLASLAQSPRGRQLLSFEYVRRASTMIIRRSCGSCSEAGARGRLLQECPRKPSSNNARS
eukprot:984702-Pyramimonas_sp.AAC.1